MTTPAKDLLRLGRLVRERREDLNLRQDQMVKYGGPSTTTLSKVENGLPPAPARKTKLKLEASLDWLPGSVDSILNGGDPRIRTVNPDEQAIKDELIDIITRGEAALAESQQDEELPFLHPHAIPEELLGRLLRRNDNMLDLIEEALSDIGDHENGESTAEEALSELSETIESIARAFAQQSRTLTDALVEYYGGQPEFHMALPRILGYERALFDVEVPKRRPAAYRLRARDRAAASPPSTDQQADYDLAGGWAAQHSDEPKGSDPKGLDDDEE